MPQKENKMSNKPEEKKAAAIEQRKVEGSVHLELAVNQPVDPSELIEEYNGKMVLWDSGGKLVIGEVQFYVVRAIEMITRGTHPFTELDALCQDTSDFCALYTETEADDRWTRVVYGVYPEAKFGNLLILNRVVVNEPFRQKKEVGLHFIELILRMVGGMSLVALRPEPELHAVVSENDPEAIPARDERAARGNIMSYFSRLGFRVLWGDDFMVLDPRGWGLEESEISWQGEEGRAEYPYTEEMEKYRVEE